MSSASGDDVLPVPLRGPSVPVVKEFVEALRRPRTFDLRRNPYVLFGFLWGLPIPFFSCAIDCAASGRAFSPSLFLEHPVHLFFLLHPFLFGALFGAMGTIRHRKDRLIAHLLDELERRLGKLAAAREKLKELDRLKAEFMANVTHELKTPLVAIRGYSEAILEGRFGPLTEKQQEGLGISVRNVDRLQGLIDELLEFERIGSGNMSLTVTDFDLVPVVHAALKTFGPPIEAKRLSVQLLLPRRLMVRADRERIARVVLNLLSNAVKFSGEGAPLGVNARVDAEKGRALVTVWDQGPGIPTAAQKFLFTRFWQADGSSRRRFGGTGLGLAIAKGILDAHGSSIQVVSSEGAGTMVHFDLPLSAALPGPAREEREEISAHQAL